MEPLTTLDELRRHVRVFACIDESEDRDAGLGTDCGNDPGGGDIQGLDRAIGTARASGPGVDWVTQTAINYAETHFMNAIRLMQLRAQLRTLRNRDIVAIFPPPFPTNGE